MFRVPPRTRCTRLHYRLLLAAAVLIMTVAPGPALTVADAQLCSGAVAGSTTVSALIRDFQSIHPDFMVDDGDSAGFVAPNLGPDRKPQYSPSGAGTTTVGSANSFAKWWNDDPDPSVSQSLTTNLTFTNACQTDPRVFAFTARPYYPIDNQLLGNPQSSHNFFFTEEIHTRLSYRGGEVLTYTSADDLWVFINGHLAVDLGGVHPPMSFTLNLDNARNSLQIGPGHTYDLDVFFAHRGRHQPVISVQTTTPLASCDPLSVPATTKPSGADLAVLGQASLNAGNLRVIASNSGASLSGAGWYRSALYLASGFSTDFDFTVAPAPNSNAEGFAFVVQAAGGLGARGMSGEYLGYDSIPGSLAVEFDSHPGAAVQDPGYQHVSVHAGRNGAGASANESASLGTSPIARKLALSDGTSQHARIDYHRGAGSGPSWITVWTYPNASLSTAPERLVPILNTPIPGDNLGDLGNTKGPVFVGFTAASGDLTTLETVDISNWTIQSGAPSPDTSSLNVSPPSTVGQPRQDTLQLRDACGAPFPVSSSAAAISLFVIGPVNPATGNAVDLPASLQDNVDGTFTLSYMPVVAGAYEIFVRFAGRDINASPYMAKIGPPAGP